MNTFNVSHVFHIKKSAQLYIEEIQEKVEINKCVYNSDCNFTDGTLSPIFFYIYTWNYSWRHDTNIIYFIFPTHTTYSFMSLQVATAVSNKNCMKNG